MPSESRSHYALRISPEVMARAVSVMEASEHADVRRVAAQLRRSMDDPRHKARGPRQRTTRGLGIDWSPMLREDRTHYPVPDGVPPVRVAKAAGCYAYARGVKIATRSDRTNGVVHVYVLSRPA